MFGKPRSLKNRKCQAPTVMGLTLQKSCLESDTEGDRTTDETKFTDTTVSDIKFRAFTWGL